MEGEEETQLALIRKEVARLLEVYSKSTRATNALQEVDRFVTSLGEPCDDENVSLDSSAEGGIVLGVDERPTLSETTPIHTQRRSASFSKIDRSSDAVENLTASLLKDDDEDEDVDDGPSLSSRSVGKRSKSKLARADNGDGVTLHTDEEEPRQHHSHVHSSRRHHRHKAHKRRLNKPVPSEVSPRAGVQRLAHLKYQHPSSPSLRLARAKQIIEAECIDKEKVEAYYNEHITTVVRCQGHIRAWMARRRMQNLAIRLLNDGGEGAKRIRKRNDVIREIISTEKSFMKSLSLLKSKFITPLKEYAGTKDEILPKQDIRVMFAHLDSISSCNLVLLQKLETEPLIGRIFVDCAPYFRMYKDYVTNFDAAVKARQKHSTNKAFIMFLQDRRDDKMVRGMSLSDFMIQPVQRIPRYNMLLKELRKYTPQEHVDSDDLDKAISLVGSITQDMDKAGKMAENCLAIYQVLQSITNYTGPALVSGTRRYIREGPLLRGTLKTRRYLYLLSDVIILTSNEMYGSTKTFRTILWLVQDNVQVSKLQPRDSGMVHKHGFLLSIRGGAKKIPLYTSTDKEKDSWMSDIRHAIEGCQESTQLVSDEVAPDGSTWKMLSLGTLARPQRKSLSPLPVGWMGDTSKSSPRSPTHSPRSTESDAPESPKSSVPCSISASISSSRTITRSHSDAASLPTAQPGSIGVKSKSFSSNLVLPAASRTASSPSPASGSFSHRASPLVEEQQQQKPLKRSMSFDDAKEKQAHQESTECDDAKSEWTKSQSMGMDIGAKPNSKDPT